MDSSRRGGQEKPREQLRSGGRVPGQSGERLGRPRDDEVREEESYFSAAKRRGATGGVGWNADGDLRVRRIAIIWQMVKDVTAEQIESRSSASSSKGRGDPRVAGVGLSRRP